MIWESQHLCSTLSIVQDILIFTWFTCIGVKNVTVLLCQVIDYLFEKQQVKLVKKEKKNLKSLEIPSKRLLAADSHNNSATTPSTPTAQEMIPFREEVPVAEGVRVVMEPPSTPTKHRLSKEEINHFRWGSDYDIRIKSVLQADSTASISSNTLGTAAESIQSKGNFFDSLETDEMKAKKEEETIHESAIHSKWSIRITKILCLHGLVPMISILTIILYCIILVLCHIFYPMMIPSYSNNCVDWISLQWNSYITFQLPQWIILGFHASILLITSLLLTVMKRGKDSNGLAVESILQCISMICYLLLLAVVPSISNFEMLRIWTPLIQLLWYTSLHYIVFVIPFCYHCMDKCNHCVLSMTKLKSKSNSNYQKYVQQPDTIPIHIPSQIQQDSAQCSLFAAVMNEPKYRKIFREQLKREFCEEQLLFYEQVFLWKQMQHMKQSYEAATQIKQLYLLPTSVHAINAPTSDKNHCAAIVEECIEKQQPIPLDTFQHLEDNAIFCLFSDCFYRFLSTEECSKIKQELL